MYSPRGFFEAQSKEVLGDYLFDIFERYSLPEYTHLDELTHALKIKEHVAEELKKHDNNKAISHEMWATAVLIGQYEKASGKKKPRIPMMLGPDLCNNPAFTDAHRNVRTYLQTQELKRA